MRTAIVIRTRDEAPRLALTLAALERQGADEVVVVDDGSADETPSVIAAATLPLIALRNATPHGRAAASNRGAMAATADLLIFLDGDTLAGPGMVAAHLAAHSGPTRIGRGETWHLRCTRFLADPETACFQPAHVAREAAADRAALAVTRAQVRDDFAAIERRAKPGVYPGVAPERLHVAEMAALRDRPDGARLWAAASGSNLSVPADAFRAIGGFDSALTINEHRELAYRLCAAGARMTAVPDARSFHLTHREGWRDPLVDRAWEARFRSTHPEAPLDALIDFWRSLATTSPTADFFAA